MSTLVSPHERFEVFWLQSIFGRKRRNLKRNLLKQQTDRHNILHFGEQWTINVKRLLTFNFWFCNNRKIRYRNSCYRGGNYFWLMRWMKLFSFFWRCFSSDLLRFFESSWDSCLWRCLEYQNNNLPSNKNSKKLITSFAGYIFRFITITPGDIMTVYYQPYHHTVSFNLFLDVNHILF